MASAIRPIWSPRVARGEGGEEALTSTEDGEADIQRDVGKREENPFFFARASGEAKAYFGAGMPGVGLERRYG